MENGTNAAAEAPETEQQAAQLETSPTPPTAAAEAPDPKAAVFAELGIDGIEAFNQLKETAEAAETYKSELEAANKTNSFLQANIEALNLGANPETAAELAEIALGKVTKDTDIKSVMSMLKNSAAYSGFFKDTKILKNTGTPVSNQSKPLPPAENYGAKLAKERKAKKY